MELEFIGAAQTVTGSKHLLRTSRAEVLLDCGLFQGRRSETLEKNLNIAVDTEKLSAVVLSHAHIDHSGALPALHKKGYRGPIFATPATRDLCAPMLMDAAHLMRADAAHIERLMAGNGHGLRKATPIYQQEDVIQTLASFVGLPYERPHEVAPGVVLTFLDAGHVLGSAICVLDVEDKGKKVRLAYTGDLGRKRLPILRDPQIPRDVDFLLMESTYGDRFHEPFDQQGESLAQVINRTLDRKGKLVIPSFALERAQEIIFTLKKLRDAGKVPKCPVYMDSPLAIKLTEIFALHPDCYDRETYQMLRSSNSPFDFPGLTYVSSASDSKAIDQSPQPCIIISASGMCEGGRVLHHLHATIEDAKNTILIVGYQAEHTLGRKILEGVPEVKIFGIPHRPAAEVVLMPGFSGHADQKGLLDFAMGVKSQGPLHRIILVHGESSAQQSLRSAMMESGILQISTPVAGERIKL